MDDVMISKLIIQENVKEENEKIKEEDEKNKTTEIILNERMSLNTQRNLSLINRARLKILKDNFYKNRNKIKNNNYENIESPKKENEGIFFTEPNIPIKNNNYQNISDTEENTYKDFIKNTINKIQKERNKDLITVIKLRKEMFKNEDKDYISCLWLKNKNKQYPSYKILSNLFVDLYHITKKERNKLKGFQKQKFTLPPILNNKLGRNNKLIFQKNNTINNRNINSKNIISSITVEDNINNNIIHSDFEN